MCAHLVARWSREEILNIFLYKNSPGWSGQECFLSHFKNLYNPAVRIIQGLEHQNLWANSGTPEFMLLFHLRPPFSYYYWQTAQVWSLRGAWIQVFSSALQDLTPSWSLQTLSRKCRFLMLCAGRSSHLQRSNHEWNAQGSLMHHLDRSHHSWIFIL